MERKRYLELCQKNAVFGDWKPVIYGGRFYYPKKYELGFNEKGEAIHGAILKNNNNCGTIYCNLELVEEVKNESD